MAFDFMDDEDEERRQIHLDDIWEETTGIRPQRVGMSMFYHHENDLPFMARVAYEFKRQKFLSVQRVPEKKIRILTLTMLDKFLKLILPKKLQPREEKKPMPVLTMGPVRPKAIVAGKPIDLEKLRKKRDRLRRKIAKLEARQNQTK